MLRVPSTTVRNSLPRGWTWGVFIPQALRVATVVDRPIAFRKGNVSIVAAFFLPPNSPVAGTALLKSKTRFFWRSAPVFRMSFLASGSSGLVVKRILLRSTAVTFVLRSSARAFTSFAFAAAAEAAAASMVWVGDAVVEIVLLLLDFEMMVLIVLDVAEDLGPFPVHESGPRAEVTCGAGAALTIAVAARATMRVLTMVDIVAGLDIFY